MPAFVQRIIDKKARQLKQWKEQGLETFLVVYNTAFTVEPTSQWKNKVNRSPLIDHLVVVAGNPPGDAWTEQIW